MHCICRIICSLGFAYTFVLIANTLFSLFGVLLYTLFIVIAAEPMPFASKQTLLLNRSTQMTQHYTTVYAMAFMTISATPDKSQMHYKLIWIHFFFRIGSIWVQFYGMLSPPITSFFASSSSVFAVRIWFDFLILINYFRIEWSWWLWQLRLLSQYF